MSQSENPACSERRELLLRALFEPAVEVRGPAGRVAWTRADRLRLTWVIEAIEESLAGTLEAEVKLELRTSVPVSKVPMPEQAFGWRFRTREGSEIFLTLDGAAGRALANKLEERVVGLRGVGELTDTELGLVEFVGLECLARLVDRSQGELSFDLAGSIPKSEVASTVADPELTAVGIGLTVHGRSGGALLWLPPRSGRPTLTFPEPEPTEVRRATPGKGLWCTLALPAVALASGEAENLRPGDVLLLGCPDLGGFANEASLVTTTGWCLGPARLVEDGASSATVRTGALDPKVHLLPEPPTGGSVVQPTLGWVQLQAAQLAAWEEGAPLGLRKDPEAAVLLHREGGDPLRGELVAVGSELGVRVTS